MERLGPAQQPFELSDGILAFCLYLAGLPFLTTRNLYTAEIFKALGFKGEIDLCETAQECVEQSIKGKVQYLFRKTPELRTLLKIFSDQQERVKTGEGDAKDVIRELMERFSRDEMSLEETLLRISCIILKLRGPFLNRWKEEVPLVAVINPGKPRKFKTTATVKLKGVGTETVPANGVEFPGFKWIRADASDEFKKEMGLL